MPSNFLRMPELPPTCQAVVPEFLTVEYDYTPDDFTAFNLYHHLQARPKRRSRLVPWDVENPFGSRIYWGAIGAFALSVAFLIRTGENVRTPVFMVVWIGSICFALSLTGRLIIKVLRWAEPRLLRRYVAKALRAGRNQGVFGRQRVTLTPEGITEANELRQSTVRWPAVERVVRDRAHAYIYLSSMSAVVVPQRAFASAGEFEEFVRTAECRLGNAAATPG